MERPPRLTRCGDSFPGSTLAGSACNQLLCEDVFSLCVGVGADVSCAIGDFVFEYSKISIL